VTQILRRLIFWTASLALTFGVAREWAQRKQAAFAAQEKGLPTNFDEMSSAQQRRAEKQRRKALRQEARNTSNKS
jgi:hypothetical protein